MPNLPNSLNVDITHFCFCQYDKYNSKKLYSMIYVYGSYNLSVWEVPWNCDDISNFYYMGHIKTHQMGVGIWRKLSQLLGWVLQTLPTQNRTYQTFQNCRNLDLPHVSICMYGSYNLWIWYVFWNVNDISYAYNMVDVK